MSPAEPREFHKLGQVSSLPERYGVDFLWVERDLMHGAQRKTVADLVASTLDDRLAKELQQIRALDGEKFLIVEGKDQWVNECLMGVRGVAFSRGRWLGILLAAQQAGVRVLTSASSNDTKSVLAALVDWTKKAEHSSLHARGGPVSTWGTPSNQDYQEWLLQGLPGVGPGLAKRIIRQFGGVPWQWTVTKEQLMAVEGIGTKRADQLLSAFRQVET